MINVYSNILSSEISKEIIKRKVKELRKELSLTQEKFGEKAGFPKVTIQKWEDMNKDIAPDTSSLIQLCNVYGVDMDYFTGRLDAHTRDLQFIMDYTGLSEEAIKRLHETKDKNPMSFKSLNRFLETFNNDSFDQSSGLRLFAIIYEYLRSKYIMDLLSGPNEIAKVRSQEIEENGIPTFREAPDLENKPSDTELYYTKSQIESIRDQHRFQISTNASRLFDKMYEIWPEPFFYDDWIRVEGCYISTKNKHSKRTGNPRNDE